MTKIIGVLFILFITELRAESVVVGFQSDLERLSLKQLLVEREVVSQFKGCPAESLIKRTSPWSCDKFVEKVTCKVMLSCSDPNQFLTADKYQSDLTSKIDTLVANEKIFDIKFTATLLAGEKFQSFDILLNHTPGKKDQLTSKNMNEEEMDVFLETDKEYFEQLKKQKEAQTTLDEKVVEVKKVIETKKKMANWNEWSFSLINAYDSTDRSVRSIDAAWTPFWRPTEKWELGFNLGGHFLKTSRDIATATETFVALEYFPYLARIFGKTYVAVGYGKQQWFSNETESFNLMALTIGYEIDSFLKRIFLQYNTIDSESDVKQIKVGTTFSF
ncbi:MAG: hypothetical protein JNM93_06280 [Bacteriovoracaceae bacterium]|nr:hypothetical protein [Bacteriovoracaceae bacterium]